MVNKIILTILISTSVVPASAKLLIQSGSLSNIEYEAFLKTHPEYEPVMSVWLENPAYEVSSRSLRQAFDEAEKSFLSEPVEVAYDKYKQVPTLAFKSDWSDSERQLIFHAFLRVAQTAINEKKRMEYLKLSKQFDSKLRPDDNLFPPPLIKEWDSLQAKDLFKIIQLNKSFSAYSVGFINGRKIEFKRFTVLVPKSDFRLTLLSNSKAPFTKIVNAEKIYSVKPSSPSLVEGSCKKPEIYKGMSSSAAALFAGDCVANTEGSMLGAPGGNLPTVKNKYLTDVSEKTLAQNRLETRTSFESAPFYKSGTFWVAVGAVAAYVAYKQKEDNKDSGVATQKTGF